MYRPLPDEITIKDSNIEGLGLFSKVKIKNKSFIGITHVKNEEFQDKYIRTPLGGFYNHSKNPNVIKLASEMLPKYNFGESFEENVNDLLNIDKTSNYLFLVSLKNIEPGEEIVANYTFYNF